MRCALLALVVALPPVVAADELGPDGVLDQTTVAGVASLLSPEMAAR
jgi:hypothetical protein